jgi:hypothetical protein
MQLEPAVKKEPFRAPLQEHLPESWEVPESAALPVVQPVAAEAPLTTELGNAIAAPDEFGTGIADAPRDLHET